jgi:putative flavoprotein involved in K+ transport
MDFEKKHWQTVVIGAGQAGLAVGYFLKKMKHDFIILDENEHIGDIWRKRWDSLSLFTPSQHDGLPGFAFPAVKWSYPAKEEVAGYLETYAKKFSLPVHTGIKVNHLTHENGSYIIYSSAGTISADKVVIATGTHPFPHIPPFASGISKEIYQIHSAGYRNPESLPDGDVLVVGAGVSGVEIAVEMAENHKTYISGKPTFHIPENFFKYAGDFFWWFASNILTVKTPVGKKARKKIIHGGGPLIGISAANLDIAGVERVARVAGVKDGLPLLEDGTTLRVSSIIWSTGYKPDFSWIDLDMTDDAGWPVTRRGISLSSKGLYFVGMPFQYSLTSGFLGGVGRDASYISKQIIKQNHLPA